MITTYWSKWFRDENKKGAKIAPSIFDNCPYETSTFLEKVTG